MEVPSSNKVEHRSLNALEVIIDEHGTMDYTFNSGDKELSWDGYIWLFKKDNGKPTKENLEARVAVQIKGHTDKEEKYIRKQNIDYRVDVADLKAYATEKGVLYFEIFMKVCKEKVKP